MNIPNMLTLFRLFLIPVFILVFFSNMANSLMAAVGIFLLAGLTDVLDGYIARKYNLITKWGIVMDPLSDKLMLLTVLSCLVITSYAPVWILMVVAAKEIWKGFYSSVLYLHIYNSLRRRLWKHFIICCCCQCPGGIS